jgi:hypothetical protein
LFGPKILKLFLLNTIEI